MAHFLPGRVGLERAVWAAFIPLASIAKQALTTHCDHMEEGLSLPSGTC